VDPLKPVTPRRRHGLLLLAVAGVILAAAVLTDTVRRNEPRGRPPGDDAIAPLVLRIEQYLEDHEVNGVTMDWR